MYEILSTDVKLTKKFTMKNIMSFYQETKNFNGNVYLLHKHKIINAQKLSKLVTFLMMTEENSTIKIIVEGKQVQEKLQKLESVCENAFERSHKLAYFLNPTDSVQV
ncbi:HPr family phosphocarrier protein [Peribacillus acanthi]|uniref:HPr family phosphocarrier protein n=1 Tax=Peribacillus acanthi TaxID=2171554 RepID=UPI000D3E4046|nr:HPr family phosphocarrier protein [Peribacillus acanthi]